VNVGHPEGENELERTLGATMAEVFPAVLRDPSQDTNTLLLGSTAPSSSERLSRSIPALPDELRVLARATAAHLGRRLGGGSVYTDDKAPVEWLVDKSIVDYAAGGE
jgi:hypothetical protein